MSKINIKCNNCWDVFSNNDLGSAELELREVAKVNEGFRDVSIVRCYAVINLCPKCYKESGITEYMTESSNAETLVPG